MRVLALLKSAVGEVVDQVSRLGVRDIALVRFEIGDRGDVSHDALHCCFETCTRDTPLAGAELELVEVPGTDVRLLELEVL